MRIYVVVTGFEDGNVHAFIADEGLARFCTEPYEQPTNENFHKFYMHLTNYSLNKASDGYVPESKYQNIYQPNNCSKRTLTALFKELYYNSKNPDIISEIRQSINHACTGGITMLLSML